MTSPATVPRLAMTYAVYWPEHQILKIGRAWKMSRLRGFGATGGVVIVLLRDTPAIWERGALAELDGWFERAFTRENDSLHLLRGGRGFTECFKVTAASLGRAIKTMMQGIRRYGHEEETGHPAGDVPERGPVGAIGGDEADGGGVTAVRRRSRTGVDDAGADQGGTVADGRGRDGFGDHDAAARAGVRRLPRHLPGRSAHVLPGDRVAACGPSGRLADTAATYPESIRKRSGFIRGWGGREKREGERVGGRGCVEGCRVGSRERRGGELANRSGCTTFAVLSLASSRHGFPLQELRHRSATSPVLVGSTAGQQPSHVQRGG